jgi:3',5'-cyclic AMP phosphodiesterase CpdA
VLTLIHLSDIHFRRSEGDQLLDVDAAVRTDLLNDLGGLVDEVGPATAVLVVGDLAATGASEEYDRAADFLDEACSLVQCPRSSVVCVPGNHDIDRNRHGPLHNGLRRLLRTTPPRDVGMQLGKILADEAAATVLHEPLSNYNTFALPLDCAVTAERPIWAAKELELNGRKLRIRGVNSALTCDGTESDATIESRVVLGDVQLAQLVEDHEVISVLLCHHPLSWLRDAEAVEPWLTRPHLLLTGHTHDMAIVERADGRSAVIAAGAVTPERTKRGWQPAYNVLQLGLTDDHLVVEVRVRCYESGRTGFGPDDRFDNPHQLRLPLPRAEVATPDVRSPAAPEPAEPLESDEHAMVYEVLIASPDTREQVAKALNLLSPDDRLDNVGDERRLIERARMDGKLRELADALRKS